MKKEELLIITLAVVIFIAIFIIVEPSITGFVTYEFSNYTYNNNIIVNEAIQLKQHNTTETTTTEQTCNYNLTYAFYDGKTKMPELIEFDDKYLEIDKKLVKIKFNNTLENGDIINTYLKNDQYSLLKICNFDAESTCENATVYSTLEYNGQEGFYQFILSLQEPINEFAVESSNNTKCDHFNASHIEITEYSNITYYYNSDSIESETIEPLNFLKWDLFTVDYTLNNQTINFYYKTNQDYIEFTSPYNFSEINSSTLQFKLDLFSDNSSTPIIYNLSINYIETVEQNETTEEPPQNETEPSAEEAPSSSSQQPSTTRYKSSTPTVSESPKTETKTVSLPVELKTTPEPQIQEVTKPNIKVIGNTIAISYLAFICLLLYRRRQL